MLSSCATLIGVDEAYTEVDDAFGGAGGDAGSAGSTDGSGGQAGGSGGAAGSGVGGDGAGGSSGGGASGSGGTPGDAPTGPEDCDNGIDDDADGKTDCFDSDCDADAFCAGKCRDAAVISCNNIRVAQNTGAAGGTQRIAPPAYGCSGAPRPGPEYAYRFGGQTGQTVFVELYGLSGDLALSLTDVAAGAQCDAAGACARIADDSAGTGAELLSFVPAAGRDYFLIVDGAAAADYALSVQCSPASGCSPAQTIEAGQTINASNAMGSPNVTNVLSSWSCAFGSHSAPEAAFMFTPTVTADYRVAAQNLTTNLDLFVVAAPTCNSTCATALSRSAGPSAQDEILTFRFTAGTTYYIVVDGYGVGTFTLSVTQL